MSSEEKAPSMSSEEKAKALFALAIEKKPRKPIAYDLRKINPLWDFAIFMSVLSLRQADAVLSVLRRGGRDSRIKLHHAENGTEGGWVLLDFGDVVVHVFTEEAREYYALEKIFGTAPTTTFGLKIEELE
jgi:ribosome-associated protein